ncbi:MAG: phospholipase D-like domain-containing protein, partial [Candidatus Dormibacterales bacterium]
VHAIARRIHAARRRIRICSPVITSGPVLGTLAELLEAVPAGLSIGGAFDGTQMREVMAQWAGSGTAGWKMEAFRSIVNSGLFSAKASTPYGEGTVHDFMHAKLAVLDDRVFVGSFNLSHSGESNAENVLEIEDAPLADLCADFVDLVAARYPKASSLGD